MKDNTNSSFKIPNDNSIIPTNINTSNVLESNNVAVNASTTSIVISTQLKIIIGLAIGLLVIAAIAIPLGVSINRDHETIFVNNTSTKPETVFVSSIIETISKMPSSESENINSVTDSVLGTKEISDKKENEEIKSDYHLENRGTTIIQKDFEEEENEENLSNKESVEFERKTKEDETYDIEKENETEKERVNSVIIEKEEMEESEKEQLIITENEEEKEKERENLVIIEKEEEEEKSEENPIVIPPVEK